MKILIITILLLASSVYAKTLARLQLDETFTNPNCSKSDSCSLTSFRLKVEDLSISGTFGTNYTTRAYMAYTTDSIDNLENYGIVQFIRGCQWTSYSDGRAIFDTSRHFFGNVVPFIHPDFVVDSVDTDPLYNSYLPTPSLPSRHSIWRHNSVKNSFAEKTESFLYKSAPKYPSLYARDTIGTVSVHPDNASARNSSLEFQTCIYKIEDIPMESGPGDMSPEQALKCYRWVNSYIFDHKLKTYKTSGSIDPICLGDAR